MQSGPSGDKHAITITEEPIFLLYGPPVCCKNVFSPGKRAYKHQKTGLRKMEIGEHCLYQAEFEARRDEDFRSTGMSFERSAGALLRTVLQRPDDRSAHRNDAPAFTDGAVQCVSGCGAQCVPLAVELYFVQAFDAKWSKGSQADVESDPSKFNSTHGHRLKYLRSEMQASRGGRD